MGGDLAELINRCATGDDEARAAFCQGYLGLVKRAVARKLAALHAEAVLWAELEDMSHDVFVRLFADECRALKRVRNPSSIDAWLVAVAQNHAVDCARRHSARRRVQRGCENPGDRRHAESPEKQVSRSDEISMVRARLREMTAKDRVLLELYYLDGLKYAEIARMMRLNINTVAARLRRAKAKLREALEQENNAFGWA